MSSIGYALIKVSVIRVTLAHFKISLREKQTSYYVLHHFYFVDVSFKI